MDGYFFMNNGPLNGQLSIFLLCCISNYLTTFLLMAHPIQSYYKDGIDEVLGL